MVCVFWPFTKSGAVLCFEENHGSWQRSKLQNEMAPDLWC